MKQSMVDYVLERGNKDYGEFYRRSEHVEPTLKMNQRKLLQYLFNPNKSMKTLNRQDPATPSISELKYAEIVTQFNYVSEKLHSDMNKKNVVLDSEIYKMQHQWTIKKIPQFYCYYFLKFVYANKPTRLQDIIFQQLSNMNRQNDTYTVMRKAIEARQACLSNLKRQAVDLSMSQITKDLLVIQQELAAQVKLKLTQEARSQSYRTDDLPTQKDWKNKLELFFDSVSHLRKLTLYVVEMVTRWKNTIYSLTEDPKRFRQRIIFYHNGVNYLLKILNDTRFLKDMPISDCLSFSECYDPFILRPLVVLESIQDRSVDQSILYSLMKPKETQMKKIINCLELLAEEEYDEDSHSRFLTEKKNTGELRFKKDTARRGLAGEETPPKRLDGENPEGKEGREGKEARSGSQMNRKQEERGKPTSAISKARNAQNTQSVKGFTQTVDKRSMHTKKMAEQVQQQKAFGTQKIRTKAMSSLDLKKVSPYLARNQKLALAQKVVQLEHQYKQAKALYVASTRKDLDNAVTAQKPSKQIQVDVPKVEDLKQYADTRVFNKYVQENLKQLEQADKKKYLYKNRIPPNYQGPKVNYKKLNFYQRKQFQYNQNLKQYVNPLDDKKQSKKVIHNPTYKTPGTKAVIQISNQGIRRKDKQVLFTSKPLAEIIDKASDQDFQKRAMKRLNPQAKQPTENDQSSGLYEMGRKPEIIVLRQEPEKLEEIKNFLYAKIKAELTEELVKQNKERDSNVRDLIDEERRRRAGELIEQQQHEEIRRQQEQERRRKQQLEMQRNKINNDMYVQPIQISEQNLQDFLTNKALTIQPIVFTTLFNCNVQSLLHTLTESLYCILLKIHILDNLIGYAITSYDDRDLFRRKWSVNYLTVSEPAYSVSAFHYILNFLWKNDPVEEIDMVLVDNKENAEGGKVLQDIQEYADRNGLSFSKQLYSNSTENKFVFVRNTELFPEGVFKDRNNLFGRSMVMKAELMSANIGLTEGTPSKIDLNLEQSTNYIFLLEELFRNYMTPEEIVELRENTQNIRRLKDIFKIVLELEKNQPKVSEFKVLQGLNMQDLNDKIRQHTSKPYQKYYWKEHYDMDKANRILLAILQQRIQLPYPINSCIFNQGSYMRLRIRQKILTLKSSISPQDLIYILPTKNQKIKFFFLSAVVFKQMRIELFMFLNLLFNNIVRDEREYIENLWLPQFKINNQNEHSHKFCQKQITRVTDFSITMKKNIWLTEEVYFCNREFVRAAVSFTPRQTDVLVMEPYIFGVLHTDIEKESPGVPLYSKVIEKAMFYRQGL